MNRVGNLGAVSFSDRMPDMQYVEVPLRAIDFRDERFRTSSVPPPEGLLRSIQKVGLVSPPVVCRRERRYVLVTGWKRALACRSLGFRRLAALIIPEKSDRRLLLMAVDDNVATRELGLAEKATVLLKLGKSGQARSSLIKEYAPRLGLPATFDVLEGMLALARADRVLRDFVSEKSSSLAVVKALLRFPPGDIRPLLPLLRTLGQNKQRQVLEDLWDIVRRDGISVRSLLRRKRFRGSLDSPSLSLVQKAEGIRKRLRTVRYPALSAREEAFHAARRKVRWPGGVSVQPSPFFEEECVAISFRSGNRQELQAVLEKLREAAAREGIDGLFREKE